MPSNMADDALASINNDLKLFFDFFKDGIDKRLSISIKDKAVGHLQQELSEGIKRDIPAQGHAMPFVRKHERRYQEACKILFHKLGAQLRESVDELHHRVHAMVERLEKEALASDDVATSSQEQASPDSSAAAMPTPESLFGDPFDNAEDFQPSQPKAPVAHMGSDRNSDHRDRSRSFTLPAPNPSTVVISDIVPNTTPRTKRSANDAGLQTGTDTGGKKAKVNQLDPYHRTMSNEETYADECVFSFKHHEGLYVLRCPVTKCKQKAKIGGKAPLHFTSERKAWSHFKGERHNHRNRADTFKSYAYRVDGATEPRNTGNTYATPHGRQEPPLMTPVTPTTTRTPTTQDKGKQTERAFAHDPRLAIDITNARPPASNDELLPDHVTASSSSRTMAENEVDVWDIEGDEFVLNSDDSFFRRCKRSVPRPSYKEKPEDPNEFL